MKGLAKFVVGAVLGGVLGWGMGYLRIPMMEKDDSFWVGFAMSLAMVLLVIVAMIAWNKNAMLLKLIGRDSAGRDPGSTSKPVRNYVLLWTIMAGFVVLGGSVSSWMVYRQNGILGERMRNQDQRIWQQSELIESIRKSSQVILMGSVLDQVEEDIKSHPGGTLRDETIARVAALSYSLKPYASVAGDSLARVRLSPERGQLLLALCLMEIDSVSFAKIKQSAIFFQADLSEADLKGADLSGANLREANLRGANLQGTNLRKADLKKANVWGANLNDAKLGGANLNRADLRWAQLNHADLRRANLNGINLTSAQLIDADLSNATFNWAKVANAMLYDADITNVDMQGTNFERANLSKVNFSESNLLLADFQEAIIKETEFNYARVDKNWEEKVTNWKIVNAQQLLTQYDVVTDTTGKYFASKFFLNKVK